jgi:hypothetical protein
VLAQSTALEEAMQPRFSGAILSCLLALAIAALATLAQAQNVFVTPVPNAPFSAAIDVQRSFVGPDGRVVQVKTVRQIARDNRGRIYNENRELLPIASSDTPRIRRIHLYDPETRISTMLDPNNKTYWTTVVRRPPPTVPPAMAASPTGNALPASEFSKKEDLGTTEMEGLPVHGVREIQTIPAASSGTGKDVVVTDEYWYSEDLRINVKLKHDDPRMGSVTMTVTQISRREPSSALFEIPQGYKPPNE